MSSSGFRRSVPILVALALATTGCRSDPPRTQVVDVERCERGATAAAAEKTPRAGFQKFYSECANVFVEPGCRSAMVTASNLEPAVQGQVVAEACSKAYCPILPNAGDLEICNSDFKSSPESLLRAWPAFQGVAVNYDAKDLAPRVFAAMLEFTAGVAKWLPPPAPTKATAPDAGTAKARAVPASPPPSAATPLLRAPSASAAPAKTPAGQNWK